MTTSDDELLSLGESIVDDIEDSVYDEDESRPAKVQIVIVLADEDSESAVFVSNTANTDMLLRSALYGKRPTRSHLHLVTSPEKEKGEK